jgi:hypothetical protein
VTSALGTFQTSLLRPTSALRHKQSFAFDGKERLSFRSSPSWQDFDKTVLKKSSFFHTVAVT